MTGPVDGTDIHRVVGVSSPPRALPPRRAPARHQRASPPLPALLYRPLVLETVDPSFLSSVSRAGAPTQLIFLAIVVMNLVAGFNALGTLLAVGLMMLPAACARLWASRLTGMFAVATGVALASVYIGLVASYYAGAPSGPAIILAAGVFYAISVLFGRAGGVIRKMPAGKHLEA